MYRVHSAMIAGSIQLLNLTKAVQRYRGTRIQPNPARYSRSIVNAGLGTPVLAFHCEDLVTGGQPDEIDRHFGDVGSRCLQRRTQVRSLKLRKPPSNTQIKR